MVTCNSVIYFVSEETKEIFCKTCWLLFIVCKGKQCQSSYKHILFLQCKIYVKFTFAWKNPLLQVWLVCFAIFGMLSYPQHFILNNSEMVSKVKFTIISSIHALRYQCSRSQFLILFKLSCINLGHILSWFQDKLFNLTYRFLWVCVMDLFFNFYVLQVGICSKWQTWWQHLTCYCALWTMYTNNSSNSNPQVIIVKTNMTVVQGHNNS